MRSLLFPTFNRAFLPRITDQNASDVGLEQGVQPGRAGSLFEGHLQDPAQTVDTLQKGFRFRSRMASIINLPVESNTLTEIVAR